jgi:diguanylate cyclase (GGDEF)-like protein/PAS domain S-box-containing protein
MIMLSRTVFAPLTGVVMALVVVLGGEYGYRVERLRSERDQRSTAVSTVAQYRAALEGELNSSLYLTDGLVAYVKTHTAMETRLVQLMLKTLYERARNVRNIGLAPGNRLSYVYPLEGNEKAIGIYYPDLPDQWPAVERAILDRRPRLAGPVDLKQGGVGFIYRVPVFIGPDQTYWGLLSMVIDKDALFDKAGIAPEKNGMLLALRGKDGNGADGETFLGDAALFAADSVKATVSTPGGAWQLAAIPAAGWTTGKGVVWIRVGGWLIGVMLGLSLYAMLVSIRRRLQAEDAFVISRNELNEAQRIGMIGSWALDLRSNVLTWSDEIYRIFEIDPAKSSPSYETFLNTVHPEDRERVDSAYNRSVANHKAYEIVHRLLMADGRIKYVRECCETSYDENGVPLISRGTTQDITKIQLAEEALKASEERWKFALEGSGDGVWDWNLQTGELFLSRQEMTVLGFDGEDATHTHIDEWVDRQHPDDRRVIKAAIDKYLSGEASIYSCEFRTKTRDGTWRWIQGRGMLVSQSPDGRPLRMIGVHTDISERKQAEEALIHLANTDFLTGVSNRRHFLEELETELSRSARSGGSAVLLMVDIDHFKNINDTYGHAGGDAVLKHFTALSLGNLRRADCFGRLGGEEFAFLLPDTDSASARRFADRFRRLVADTPAPGPKGPIAYTASIGIAECGAGDCSVDGILAKADAALYLAKASGRNRVSDGTNKVEVCTAGDV